MIDITELKEEPYKPLAEYSQEELLARFAVQFDIAEETAKPSVLAFLSQLRDNGLLDE